MPTSFYLFVNPNSQLYLSITFFYLTIFFVYPPIFVSISCLSISISSYLFVNLDWCLSLSIFLSIQIHGYIFQSRFLSHFILSISICICFYLLSIHLYFFILLYQCRLMSISFYLFVNPNSRLYLSNLFSLSHSILCISTYICFYLMSIHLYFFIPPCQSRLKPISLYIFVNLNSRLYLSTPFSLSQPNLHLSTCIYIYLFSIHHYFFLSLIYSNLNIYLF